MSILISGTSNRTLINREGFCKLVDRTTLLNEIMTTVEDLVSDTSQHVRAALGTQISGLAPILGKQEYVFYLHTFISCAYNIF